MSTSAKTGTTNNNPLLISEPWAYVGLSRSAFYRLMSAGEAPRPVPLSGTRLRWRRADLDAWVSRLKPGARRRRACRAAEPAQDDNHAS
jgi:predicted DNA-binding transcriptional regulator AlpA